ncbi:MAG: inositol monophosphatase family protein [Mariprofundaceae bacterium]|nr:inositol monophosphatase family protein [Mariprofundaceae bacterium]
MRGTKHNMQAPGTKRQSSGKPDVLPDVSIKHIAAILEQAGAQLLMPAFSQVAKTIDRKQDGSIVTATDIACQQRIRQALFEAWPAIGFLGEEMTEQEQQACLHQGGCYWCLDPLDGTSNFVASFPAFALSLALIENGAPTLACIHDPVRKETFSAVRGQGASLNGKKIRAKSVGELRDAVGFIDFKRLDEPLKKRLTAPGIYRSQRNIGSCALEWAWLAAGRAQFIIHGGEKIWDYAGGGLIAAESGCILSDFNGAPLFDDIQPVASIIAAASDSLHENLRHACRLK